MITYCRAGLLSPYGARLLPLLGLVGLLLLLGCNGGKDTAPGAPQTTAPDMPALDARVFPPDALPFGKGYDEWSAEWWQWVFSIPASTNPLLDATGEQCATAQRGPAWFLAGVTMIAEANTYHCAVSEGTALFLPIITVEKDNLGVISPRPMTELRDRVTSDLNGVTDLRVEVDGVSIRHLELFRFTSPVFSVTLPPNNVLQATGHPAAVPGTIFLAIAEGFYVMLKPLPVGEHTIAIRGRIPAIALTLDVTYHLSITLLPPILP